MGFLLSIETPRARLARSATVQSRFQALLHETLADPRYAGDADLQSLRDLLVRPAGPTYARIRLEQNPCMDLLSRAGAPRIDHLLKARPLLCR
jgi:hypothetical protein